MIPTSSVIAIRCPECGKIEYFTVSLFSFSHENTNAYICSCGYEIMKLTTKKRNDFWLQYNCAMCENRHLIALSRRQIWFNDCPLDILCDETGIEVGFIGSREKVKEKIKRQDQSLAEMADKLGFTDFFNNSSVMYEVLEHLYDVAEDGKLFCSCGNFNIDIEIFPDYIELSCDNCKAKGRILADKEEDADNIKGLTEIILSRKGFVVNHNKDYNNHNF